MRVLSAADAIQPAWDHARRLTVSPRSWRLAFKLTAVAFFARLGGCNTNFNSWHGARPPFHMPMVMHTALYGLFVVLAIVAFVITLAFFYLRSRLQFVLFDFVLRSDSVLTPIWRRYARATWYWIGLKVAFFAIALACVAPLIVPVVIQFIHALRAGHGHVNPASMFAGLFSLIGTLFLALLVIGVGYTLLVDFGLPSMALEGTPLGTTVVRVWTLLRTDTGQVLLYLLMRFVMGIAASICCGLAILAASMVAMIPLGAAALATWLGLRHASLNGHIVMVTALVLLGCVFVAAMMVAVILTFGYAQIFFQSYALYFLAGRYPLLAQYLAPSLPPQMVYAYPPPVADPPL
jgi:hypothetical protein